MRSIKIWGLCLLGICATGAVGATSASAALPELGRCVKTTGVVEGKKTVYSGAYAGKNCLNLAKTHKGKYEFLPGPGAKNKFTGQALEPEPLLETTTGAKLFCSSASFKEGEYTGPKSEKVGKVLLSGCSDAANRPCQTTPAKEGEVESLGALEGTLGPISSTPKAVAGWDLKREGTIFSYTCGKLPEVGSVNTIEGSVIGALAAGSESDVNRMSLQAKIVYKQSGGKQIPEMFEGGTKDTLSTSTVGGASKVQTGLATVELAESGLGEPVEKEINQEPLEVKVSGAPAGG